MMTSPIARAQRPAFADDDTQVEATFWLALFLAIHSDEDGAAVSCDEAQAAAAAETFIAILARHLGAIRAAKVLVALGPRTGDCRAADALRLQQNAALLGIRKCTHPQHARTAEPGERRLETPFGCIRLPMTRLRAVL